MLSGFVPYNVTDNAVTPTSHGFGRKQHGKSDNAVLSKPFKSSSLQIHFGVCF